MTCDICGKDSPKIRYVTRSYEKQERLIVIENIPAIYCSQCKESYLTADTLHELEWIKPKR
ncbi:type II toxin-antitoxin system MqsA family antitoxin [Candidatus Electrothrix sp.]|uniref:type II toxin-antitoxin system MqsA family antitoxin n=1 Tax=Candidatus Electrothrix sp. TaxID=2170559 RepID=UPI004056FFC2